ncbi:MAG: ABC transporter permease [Candidatus Obscuribacterales bacterium]|nr:ABC transporter permease [Candidatus Obscuribacterales bacterium]
MRKIDATLAIATNTYREAVRDRVLYAFLIFACLLTVLGILLGSLSVGQDMRIIEDLGLAVIAIIGGIITVFAGTNLIAKEWERRTVYVIFSKPVSSWQFIAGKYLGLALCILVMLFAMGAFLVLLVFLVDPMHQIQFHLPWLGSALALIYLELLFVLSMATFFSTFSSPIMSVLFTLSLWFIGHLTRSLQELSHMSTNSLVADILNNLYWLLPDLASLTRVRAELAYGQMPSTEMLLFLICYIAAFILLLLGPATLVNEKREFP